MNKWLSISLVLFGCSFASADDVKPTPKIPPSEFTTSGHTKDLLTDVKKRIENKTALLLDVRELNEWQSGHLKYATLVPLSAIRTDSLTKKMKQKLVKDKPIYVHCAAGVRAALVSKALRKQGYDIRALKQGYAELLKQGFQKATESEKPKPKGSQDAKVSR